MSGDLLLQWMIAAIYASAGLLLIAGRYRPKIEPVAVGVAVLGLLLHLGMVLVRGLDSGQIPIVTRYENFTVDALFMAGTYVLAQWRWPRLRQAGIFVLLFAAFGVVAALTYSRGVFPMSPALRTNWLVIHATLNSFAVGFAVVALAAGLMAKRCGDEVVGRLLGWTFFYWSAMVAAGSYWASIAWGRFWAWDPIECWSLATMLMYGYMLHLRFRPQWRTGLRNVSLGLLAFGMMMFTTYGLVFVMRSAHGQYVFQ